MGSAAVPRGAAARLTGRRERDVKMRLRFPGFGARRMRWQVIGAVVAAAGVVLLARPAIHLLTAVRAQATTVPESRGSGPAPTSELPPAEGEALGRLEVPRLGLDLVVFEGTSEATLHKGPGHLSGTAWPTADAPGNCVIAGHRDSFFRRLASARVGDLVRLKAPSGTSTYRLAKRRIVKPADRSVVAPTSDARLTLITCYPFDFTGSAPYRLVWNAVRLEPEARVETAGNPGNRSP